MFKILMSFLATFLVILPLVAQGKTMIREEEAEAIGIEAYIYGYPLILMDATKRVMTNVQTPTASKAPIGQFAHMGVYPDASFKDVRAPNIDTLYSVAWLDLSDEPYLLHLPEQKGRYYVFQLLSGWTNVFESLGLRTTGSKAADFAITGLSWKGILPDHVKEIKSPTNMVWILGRTYCTCTPEDYKAVHAIQNQYSLTPLSSFDQSYKPPIGTVDPTVDMISLVRKQVNQMDAETFFKKLSLLMRDSPPSHDDTQMIAKLAKIGLIPGQEFDINSIDPILSNALSRAPKLAQEKIAANIGKSGKIENGWVISIKTGNYGTDYLQRATLTAVGLGASLPEDAVFPFTDLDSDGHLLAGSNHYVLHFPKEQSPPSKGFWSLTIYNDRYFFVDNPLNRYSLSPRDQLKYNQDGSLDLYIQNEAPEKDKLHNWLPAPTGNFILMLRLYWPEETLLKGTWTPPPVKKVQ